MFQVSILVPIYRVAPFIERCARSLFEQTYPDLELIFVDDCSPDDSVSILQRVLDDYPQRKKYTRILRHERNRGLSAARNTALDNANGVFLSIVDSDDWLEKDAIERLVNLQQQTSADIVSGDAIKHTFDGEILFNEPDYPNKNSMLENLVAQMDHHMIWGRLIRRSLYLDHHIHAEEGTNVGEDWQVLVPLVFYADSIAHLKHPIYHYNCINQASYMAQKYSGVTINEKILKQDLRSLVIVKDFVQKHDDQLYRLAKLTGRKIAHKSMDLCIRENNHTLYSFIAQLLNTDQDSFDRSTFEKIIDDKYSFYWIWFNCRRAYHRIKSIIKR